MESRKPLQLLALNHVSRACSDLAASYRFYTEILGFTPVKRPSSFEFEGAWLHNYGIGLHLIKGSPPPRPKTINPKSCHISFQAASLVEVEESLARQGIPYVKNLFIEDGVQVGQLFFHDPDDNMIEICNCDVLPVVPIKDEPRRGAAAEVCHMPRAVSAAVAAAAAAWPASPAEPAPPATGLSSSAAISSDAGSDSDADSSSIHTGGFSTPSRISTDSEAPPRPPATHTCDVGMGSGAVGLPDDDCGSFSSSALSMSMSMAPSGLVGPVDSFDVRSITAADVEEWRRLASEGSAVNAISSAVAGSAFMSKQQQQQLLQHFSQVQLGDGDV